MAEHSVGGSRLQIWLSVFFAAMLLRSIPMANCHSMNTVQENITSHEDGGGRHRVTRATFSPYLDCFPGKDKESNLCLYTLCITSTKCLLCLSDIHNV